MYLATRILSSSFEIPFRETFVQIKIVLQGFLHLVSCNPFLPTFLQQEQSDCFSLFPEFGSTTEDNVSLPSHIVVPDYKQNCNLETFPCCAVEKTSCRHTFEWFHHKAITMQCRYDNAQQQQLMLVHLHFSASKNCLVYRDTWRSFLK